MRWLVLISLFACPAFAGPRFRGNARAGTFFISSGYGLVRPEPAQRVVVQPVYVPLAWWTWYPIVQPAPPAPPPQEIIVVEREVIREVPAPPVEPQVIYVEQAPAPAPAPIPEPVVAAPVPEPVKPPAPRMPGPDIFTWTDADGVTHFSTRVPAAAKARAKKVGG